MLYIIIIIIIQQDTHYEIRNAIFKVKRKNRADTINMNSFVHNIKPHLVDQ